MPISTTGPLCCMMEKITISQINTRCRLQTESVVEMVQAASKDKPIIWQQPITIMYLFLLFQQQYLQLKYPNRSYLFLYKTKDRYSISPMNIDLFYCVLTIKCQACSSKQSTIFIQCRFSYFHQWCYYRIYLCFY